MSNDKEKETEHEILQEYLGGPVESYRTIAGIEKMDRVLYQSDILSNLSSFSRAADIDANLGEYLRNFIVHLEMSMLDRVLKEGRSIGRVKYEVLESFAHMGYDGPAASMDVKGHGYRFMVTLRADGKLMLASFLRDFERNSAVDYRLENKASLILEDPEGRKLKYPIGSAGPVNYTWIPRQELMSDKYTVKLEPMESGVI